VRLADTPSVVGRSARTYPQPEVVLVALSIQSPLMLNHMPSSNLRFGSQNPPISPAGVEASGGIAAVGRAKRPRPVAGHQESTIREPGGLGQLR
jgi:hypothetical protein